MDVHVTEELQQARVRSVFERRFGRPDLLVRSPGRINLIGEHVDASLGIVLPGAIDRAIWLALGARTDRGCRVLAADTGEVLEASIDGPGPAAPPWAAYVAGAFAELSGAGPLPAGVQCVFGGDLPIGAGLSSSAALTCGLAYGLNALFGLGHDRMALARLGQRVEHHHAGVQCGVMDQVASLLGRAGRVLRLDCRDLTYRYLPLADDLAIALCDSHVRRSLAADGTYNRRRAECEEGLAALRSRVPGVVSLRDVTAAMIEDARPSLAPAVYARCRYVIDEHQRVLTACAALARRDDDALGEALNASHRGLQHDFEVSCPALDVLAEAARGVQGVVGSRMMGAGFGGYTITLVRRDALPAYRARMAEVSRRVLGSEPVIHECRLSDGTEIVTS
ncbi:MAG: galactokinase [Vicinamibacterales bacterium]